MMRLLPIVLAAMGLCVFLAFSGGKLRAQEAPMPVLSDTPEYCVLLEEKIAAHPNKQPEVRHLVREGHLLCDHGQVREGIAHLRRALLMLKHKTPVLVMP